MLSCFQLLALFLELSPVGHGAVLLLSPLPALLLMLALLKAIDNGPLRLLGARGVSPCAIA